MADFPSIGLRVDLAQLVAAAQNLLAGQRGFEKIGDAAFTAEERIEATVKGLKQAGDAAAATGRKQKAAAEGSVKALNQEKRAVQQLTAQLNLVQAAVKALEAARRVEAGTAAAASARQVASERAIQQEANRTAQFVQKMAQARARAEAEAARAAKQAADQQAAIRRRQEADQQRATQMALRSAEIEARARVQAAQAAIQQARAGRATRESLAAEARAIEQLRSAYQALGTAKSNSARYQARAAGANSRVQDAAASGAAATVPGVERETTALVRRQAQAQQELRNEIGKTRTSLVQMIANLMGMGTALEAVSRRGVGFMQFVGGAFSGLGRLRVALLNARFAVALLLGAMTVGPLVEMVDQMTALESRTRLYAEQATDVPYLFEKTYETAQRARAPLEGVAKLYTRLAPLARMLGKSQSELLRITETVSKAFSIGGASAAEAASGAQQFAQALSSNRFGGDELRSVAENAPVLLAALADGVNKINPSLNLNAATFIKWAQSGKANTETMVKALEQARGRIDAMFKQFPVTIGQATTQVSNAFAMMVDRVNQSTDASVKVSLLIQQFARFLESEQAIQGVTDAVGAFIKTMEVAGNVLEFLGRILPGVVAALTAMLIVRSLTVAYATWGAAMALAGRQATALAFAQGVATVSMRGMMAAGSGMLAMLGGPWGAAFLAAAVTVSYLASMLNDTKNAQEDLKKTTATTTAAIDRAIVTASQYGQNTTRLTQLLAEAAGVEADRGKGMDETTMKAQARANMDKAMAIAAIASAKADIEQTKSMYKRRLAWEEFGLTILRVAAVIDRITGNKAEWAVSEKTVKAQEKKIAGLKSSLQGYDEALGRLSESEKLLQGMDFKATADAAGSGITNMGNAAEDADKKTRGLAGSMKRVADLQAQLIALDREVMAAKGGVRGKDELEVYRSKLEALANYGVAPKKKPDGSLQSLEEAIQGITNANLRRLASEEVLLAGQVALKKIETERTVALIDQARELSHTNALQIESTAIADDASAAWVKFYDTAGSTAQDFYSTLRTNADAALEAEVAAEALRIAWERGYERLEDMPAEMRKAAEGYMEMYRAQKLLTQAEQEAQQFRQFNEGHAKRMRELRDETAAYYAGRDAVLAFELSKRTREIMAEAGPLMTPWAAEKKAREEIAASAKIREAQRIYNLREENRLVMMGVANREKETRVLALSDEILRQWPSYGRAFATQMADAVVQTEMLAERMAKVGGEVNDEFRKGFVEGDFDLSKLKKSATRALRESIYDALLAKPIEIVVDTTMNVVTKGLQKLLQQFMSSVVTGGGGQGGFFSGFDFSQLFGPRQGQSGVSGGMGGIGSSVLSLIGGGGNMGGLFGGGAAAVAPNAAAAGGGMFSQLGALMATPVGWIAAAVAAVMMHDQIIDSFQKNNASRASALGGNAEAASRYWYAPNSWQTVFATLTNEESNHGGNITWQGGFWDVGGAKSTKKRREQLTQVGGTIDEVINGLSQLGVYARGIITKVQAGDRDGTKVYTASGKTYRTSATDSDSIAQLIVQAILSEATFEDNDLKAIVDEMVAANRNWQQILDRMELFIAAQDLRKGVAQSLLEFTDPKSAALNALREQQLDRRRQASDYAAQSLYTPAQLAELEANLTALEMEEVREALEGLAEAGELATGSLKQMQDAQKAIIDYVRDLRVGSLSTLSPTAKLLELQGRFGTDLTAAQGGNLTALQGITGRADDYLQAAQQYYGSSAAYAAIFDQVTAALEALGLQEFEDPIVTALEEQMELLRQAIQQAKLELVAAITGNPISTTGTGTTTTPTTGTAGTGYVNDNFDYDFTSPSPYDYGTYDAALAAQSPTSAANVTELQEVLTEGFASVNDQLAGVATAVVSSNQQGFGRLSDAVTDQASMVVALKGGVVSTAKIA